jgi:hypothetical protein
MDPQAVAGKYASDILSASDIHKPEHLVDIYRKLGDQGAQWFMVIRNLGWEKPVEQETYLSAEDGRIHETFKVRTTIGDPGTGNPATFILHNDSIATTTNKFYPQVGDDVLFHNRVVGRIQTVNVSTPADPTITVEPKDATDNIGVLTAGDELSIYSNSYGEGGGQPNGRVRSIYYDSGHLKIIKTTLGATGTEMSNGSWESVYNGKTFLGIYNAFRGEDLSYRHDLAISGAMLFDKIVTNTNVVDNDANSGFTAHGTEGLIPYMERKGIPYPVASGALAVTDFYAIDLLLAKQFAPAQMMLCAGGKRLQNIENALYTKLLTTQTDYTRQVQADMLFNGDMAKAVAIGFKSVAVSERTFHIHKMYDFDNPMTVNVTGMPYQDMFFILPMDKKRDLKTGDPMPAIGSRWKQLGSYSRKQQIWRDGAAGPGPMIGDLDQNKDFMRSHIGTQFRGGNQMVYGFTS